MRITRTLLSLVVYLAITVPVQAQIALVSGQTATTSAGNLWIGGSLDETLNLPGAVTVNGSNHVIAWMGWAHGTRIPSCTHDGNAMTAVSQKNGTGDGNASTAIFARVATTTGTGVTCSLDGADANGIQAFAVAEFSGMPATLSSQGGAGVTMTTGTDTSAATTHDSGADLTPDTTDNVFLDAILCTGNGGTWGDDGSTLLVSTTAIRLGYRIRTDTTAFDWVPTTSNSVTCEVTTQNLDGAAAVAAGGSKVLLLGVGGR